MRYQLHAVTNREHTEIEPQAAAMCGSLAEARELLGSLPASPLGYAIVDTESVDIDWGAGFGIFLQNAPYRN